MDYGNLLKRAWQIIWNHKFLWALGFLAALGGGGGGSNTGWRENVQSLADPMEGLPMQEMEQALAQFEQIIAGATIAIIVLSCVFVLLGIVLWLVRLVAEAGLVDAVNKIEDGRKSSFGEALSGGAAVLLRMVGLKILLALPIILIVGVVLVFGAVLFGATAATAVGDPSGSATPFLGAIGLVLACLIPLLCIIFVLALVIAGIDLFAVRGLVIHNMGVIEAIRHGWATLRNNLGEIIVVALILFVVGLLFGLGVGLVLVPFGLIFAAPTFLSLMAGGELNLGVLATTGAGLLCLGLVGAILNAIWVAYQSTTFTLAYRHFDRGKAKLAPEAY
jgi:hypothetical protein